MRLAPYYFPCLVIEPDDGTGRDVVTGAMGHPGPNIVYLDITGLDEPLGVTDTHPIWSETRQDFVVAGQLEIGEQFRTLTGDAATLTRIHPHRGPPEMVFNLEVDGEHVYSVASNGLLVHNSGCGPTVLAYADGTSDKLSQVPGMHLTSEGVVDGLQNLNTKAIAEGTILRSQDKALDLARKIADDFNIPNPTFRLDTPEGQMPHYHVEELQEIFKNVQFWF